MENKHSNHSTFIKLIFLMIAVFSGHATVLHEIIISIIFQEAVEFGASADSSVWKFYFGWRCLDFRYVLKKLVCVHKLQAVTDYVSAL